MLIDTSVLLRIVQVHHPHHSLVIKALELLTAQETVLQIVPQNLVEFWVVATRPVAQNGLGLTPSDAAAELARLKSMFELLPETAAIFAAWEALVTEHRVSGKPSHDARLVAAMKVHSVRSILSFDQTGFSRFPGIVVVNPSSLPSL